MIVQISVTHDEFVSKNLRGESLAVRFSLGLAYCVALLLHWGQKRRSGGRAVEHPMAVADMVKSLGLTAQIVAILHDTIEDVPWYLKLFAIMLVALFGPFVLFGVLALTNWLGNDGLYFRLIKFFARFMPVIAIVKLADKLHVISTPYNKSVDEEIVYLDKTDGEFYQLMISCRQYIEENQLPIFQDLLSTLVVKVRGRLAELRPDK